jgi:hypothetical protein
LYLKIPGFKLDLTHIHKQSRGCELNPGIWLFVETAIVDYRLSFADQEKQASVFHFRLQ